MAGILTPGVGRMTPKTDVQQIMYTSITGGTYTPDNSVFVWNCGGGLLGSTNGSTYGTSSQIGIQMARHNWSSLMFGCYIETAFNQNITMNIYQMWTISTQPFYAREIFSKLLSVVIPQTAFLRFAVSDALPADGGIVGGPTVANEAHYRLSPGLSCPMIGIEFTATAPTTGRFFDFVICRSS
ncbi:MAG: hypothetical protein IT367_20405 [Candidatus Hydrogenedentes bacterium]|nr:hypothetical protein [Candidatus Hydrogenedentota bacterium]